MHILRWRACRLLLATLLTVSVAGAQPIQGNLFVTDNSVSAVEVAGSTLYIGGNFSYVGPPTGGGAVLDVATGAVNRTTARVEGSVRAAVSDGAGGVFVGGEFAEVGGIARSRLVHLLADGSVDVAFNPAPNGPVRALAVSGATLFVGGDFTSIGGQARARLAALDATTGATTPFTASITPSAGFGHVSALALQGTTLYVGGAFSGAGGQIRTNLVALDAGTGAVLPFDGAANQEVVALAASATTVYAGGLFTAIGGQSRNYLAALDAGTGAALPFNPAPGNVALALLVRGGTLYVGGGFLTIGGQARAGIAALDAATGAVLPWAPALAQTRSGQGSAQVKALTEQAGQVVLGGSFSAVGDSVRQNLAVVDGSTAGATSWTAHTDGMVEALAQTGTSVYAGGSFHSAGMQPRRFLAALDTDTGALTDWAPVLNGFYVNDLVAADGTLYVAGLFGMVDGQVQRNLAAFRLSDGVLGPLQVSVSGDIDPFFSLFVDGGTVYVGGNFTSVNGQPRSSLAAIDPTGAGAVLPWAPTPNGPVLDVEVSGSTAYIAGAFSQVGGAARSRLAAVSTASGDVTNWNPDPTFTTGGILDISRLAVSGATVFVGGAFSQIGGQPRNGVAALDAVTGLAGPLSLNLVGGITAGGGLAVAGPNLYIGGNFSLLGLQPRRSVAAIDIATGTVTDWNPAVGREGAPGPVAAFAIRGQTVYLGGSFAFVGSQQRPFLAGYADPTLAVGAASRPPDVGGLVVSSPHPNPAARSTSLSVTVDTSQLVHVEAVDMLGRRVATLFEGLLPGGVPREVVFAKAELPAGTYALRVTGAHQSVSRRVVLAR